MRRSALRRVSSTSYPITRYLARLRFAAIADPMMPRPITPTDREALLNA